jgi:hypothetical protein
MKHANEIRAQTKIAVENSIEAARHRLPGYIATNAEYGRTNLVITSEYSDIYPALLSEEFRMELVQLGYFVETREQKHKTAVVVISWAEQ